MAAEGMPFPWRWNGSTISTDLDVIWEMSVYEYRPYEVVGKSIMPLDVKFVDGAEQLGRFRRLG